MAGRYPFASSPNGWFAVAFSSELATAAVLTRRAFGHELVLFRTDDGSPAVLDAICPHMGAHLGHGGRVEAGTIRCPFHGLRFDREGTCVALPFGGKPPSAKAKSFRAIERNGSAFVGTAHARRARRMERDENADVVTAYARPRNRGK
jgi:phenylpropionate dioxygenase-like ring-hydroxylating dioxygenase large terminal subunit